MIKTDRGIYIFKVDFAVAKALLLIKRYIYIYIDI